MRACMLQAMTTQATNKLGNVSHLSTHGIWAQIATLFDRSTGEECMRLTTELKELYLKDSDYLAYQSYFNRIFDRLHTIGEDSFENLKHDLFFIGLRDWNKAFIKGKLDDVYSTG